MLSGLFQKEASETTAAGTATITEDTVIYFDRTSDYSWYTPYFKTKIGSGSYSAYQQMTLVSGNLYKFTLPAGTTAMTISHTSTEYADCVYTDWAPYELGFGPCNLLTVTGRTDGKMTGSWGYYGAVSAGSTMYVDVANWGILGNNEGYAIWFFDKRKGSSADTFSAAMTPVANTPSLYQVNVPGSNSEEWRQFIVMQGDLTQANWWDGKVKQTVNIPCSELNGSNNYVVLSNSKEGGNYKASVGSIDDDGIDDIRALNWGTNFLANVTCSGTGSITKDEWTASSTAWGLLNSGAQEKIRTAEANQEGTNLEKAVARYDYICKKYERTNYIGRDLSKVLLSGVIVSPAQSNNGSSTTLLVSIVTLTSLVSVVGAVFAWRSRKSKQQ